MEDLFYATLLFDFYGGLLTDKQRQLYEMFYLEDLSLHEIATELNITRQGVSGLVKRTKQILMDYETTLGLVAKHEKLQNKMETLAVSIQAIAYSYPEDKRFHDILIDMNRVKEID